VQKRDLGFWADYFLLIGFQRNVLFGKDYSEAHLRNHSGSLVKKNGEEEKRRVEWRSTR
jgi:hypothetical protein